jgi:hypothetical protein
MRQYRAVLRPVGGPPGLRVGLTCHFTPGPSPARTRPRDGYSKKPAGCHEIASAKGARGTALVAGLTCPSRAA